MIMLKDHKQRGITRKQARAIRDIQQIRAVGKSIPMPACRVTGKVSYSDPMAAGAALTRINEFSVERRVPTRSYRCQHCNYWHLTSQQFRDA